MLWLDAICGRYLVMLSWRLSVEDIRGCFLWFICVDVMCGLHLWMLPTDDISWMISADVMPG